MKEKQKYIKVYCKVCNENKLFVTSLSPTGTLVCCSCRYSQSMIPFKMIENSFGYKIISESIGNVKL